MFFCNQKNQKFWGSDSPNPKTASQGRRCLAVNLFTLLGYIIPFWSFCGFCVTESKIAPSDIISKFCPPAKENDVDRILTVSLEASKTTLVRTNKYVLQLGFCGFWADYREIACIIFLCWQAISGGTGNKFPFEAVGTKAWNPQK